MAGLASISLATTINELMRVSANAIDESNNLRFQNGKLEARILCEFSLSKDHTWLIANGQDSLAAHFEMPAIDKFLEAVNKRLDGVPIAFITRTQAFWSLELKVAECTLIPRQDTEVLVETALALPCAQHAKVLDLGTGTGAIALALAKEKPQWQVIGLDRIDEAVALAKENAISNNIRADFHQSNWFSYLENKQVSFDLIVSNPPYVEANSEYLTQGDLRFEPNSALVAKDDGLSDIRHIITHAKHYLKKGAYLILEHGSTQAIQVSQLMREAHFEDIQTQYDLHDLPRITLGCWRNASVEDTINNND